MTHIRLGHSTSVELGAFPDFYVLSYDEQRSLCELRYHSEMGCVNSTSFIILISGPRSVFLVFAFVCAELWSVNGLGLLPWQRLYEAATEGTFLVPLRLFWFALRFAAALERVQISR